MPRRVLSQRGPTAANKTFKPTSVGGGPLRGGIRLQGNVYKIEFFEALSINDCKTRSRSKAIALTRTRSFLTFVFKVHNLALNHIIHGV